MLDRLACETARSIVDLIDAPWVVRLACSGWARAIERRPGPVAGAVTTIERCHLAIDIGLPPDQAFKAAVIGGHAKVVRWMDSAGMIDWATWAPWKPYEGTPRSFSGR